MGAGRLWLVLGAEGWAGTACQLWAVVGRHLRTAPPYHCSIQPQLRPPPAPTWRSARVGISKVLRREFGEVLRRHVDLAVTYRARCVWHACGCVVTRTSPC